MQTRDGGGPTQGIMTEMEEMVELEMYFADGVNRVFWLTEVWEKKGSQEWE